MKSEKIQMRLAENVRKLRKEKKITQFELAEKADLSEAMIKNIELCRSWPSEKTLAQMTKALGIDIYRLFLPLAPDFEERREIRHSVKEEIAKNLRVYVDKQLKVIEEE